MVDGSEGDVGGVSEGENKGEDQGKGGGKGVDEDDDLSLCNAITQVQVLFRMIATNSNSHTRLPSPR